MLNRWLLLIISRWIMLWIGYVLSVGPYLQTFTNVTSQWRHRRNKDLISTWSESTVPYLLQFSFTHHSWRCGRKCEWVFFFWTQCIILTTDTDLSFGKFRMAISPQRVIQSNPHHVLFQGRFFWVVGSNGAISGFSSIFLQQQYGRESLIDHGCIWYRTSS